MRVAVIGAGIAGVTTAWELALAGHEVTVVERRTGAAEEASFAPTGLASPALAVPWSAAPSPWQALMASGGGAPASALWRWRQARNQRADHWQVGAAALARLVAASVERVAEISGALRFDCERADGLLVLVHKGPGEAVARASVDWLVAQGVAARWLEPEGAWAVEPSLALRGTMAAAVHLPQSRHTNAREFVQCLRAAARGRGVRFVFGREVLALQAGPSPMVRLAPPAPPGPGSASTFGTTRGPATLAMASRMPEDGVDRIAGNDLECDAIVVCANLGAKALLAPLGLALPVAALPGRSVTVPAHSHEAHRDPAPLGSVFDADEGLAICRQGTRVRVADGFGLSRRAGGAKVPGDEASRPLYRALDRWFPGAARWPQAQLWQGDRALLPDGLPLLGPSGRPGVWLNLAHGHHGWSVGCGAARALAEMVSGRESPWDVSAFAAARLG